VPEWAAENDKYKFLSILLSCSAAIHTIHRLGAPIHGFHYPFVVRESAKRICNYRLRNIGVKSDRMRTYSARLEPQKALGYP